MTRHGAVLRLRGRPAAELRRTCVALDEAGCDTIYLEQDFTACAAVAALARRARVCCLTTSRDSAAVARAAETLDYFSDGRFILGLGPLAAEDGPYSDAAAAERTIEEVLERVRKLPVLVAGDGPGPGRLAARVAGSWLTAASPDGLRDWRGEVRRASRLGASIPRSDGAVAHVRPEAEEVVAPLTRVLRSADEAVAWLEAATA
ncbi:LLM class flavin-dependent oxidoreductase [Amycolatopsis orientalis]|uniref:LLM class flavin-dependent oxidoreductase n=1 Tax=Amycolatopsis orientalis TaxID=31958 RepID=UPI00056D1BDA|nr:LLM class flavin-dependent oxidoreductase [Amycolatopsis orientalis]